MLKVAIVVSMVAVMSASYGGDNGHSRDDYSHPIPYAYGYDVKTEHGAQLSRKEEGD
ncbi:unnamed protein product, partial [Medioppia subpectinata]